MTEPDKRPEANSLLTIDRHDRDAVAMRYVYPVLSRRAGGVSVGINLNVNNACNWACVYCQVPELRRGGPPPVDLGLLTQELTSMIEQIVDGDFLEQRVPAGMRRLADVAFSGNGEPTTAAGFGQAVQAVMTVLERRGLRASVLVRVITNGSMAHRKSVIRAFAMIGAAGGEVWFKVDRARASDLLAVNGSAVDLLQVGSRLRKAAAVVPVWLQTCWFGKDGVPPSDEETDAYVRFVAEHADVVRGVHLYGIARPSMQPGGERLTRLPRSVLEQLATRLLANGVVAKVSE